MKMLSWNCQGLGRPLTVHNLKEICKSHSLEVVFMCETKNQPMYVMNILRKCGFMNNFLIDPRSIGGGLALGWKDDMKITVKDHDEFFIYLEMEDQVRSLIWNVFAVHLHSNKNLRQPQFERILQLISRTEANYIVIGDFNAITSAAEKLGGRMKATDSIDAFNNFINRGSMVDLGFVGYEFTWSNRNFGGTLVKERIDRSLVSVDWKANYPEAKLLHLDNNGSDHCPILLDASPSSRRRKRFKFQERWCGLEEVQNIVSNAWSVEVVGSPMF